MNSFDRAQRDWETPPDEPEEEYCDECEQPLDSSTDSCGKEWLSCKNPLCPNKHTGIPKEMAEKIVELLGDLDARDARIKRLSVKKMFAPVTQAKTTKHTPGPWFIDKYYKTAINSKPEDKCEFEEHKHIAMVNFWNAPSDKERIDEEEHWANVNLIVAAPDLLEALEYAVKVVPELAEVPGIAGALKKARGEK